MVLFAIICIIVTLVVGLAVVTVGTVGAAGLIIFAEPIICVALLIWLAKLFFRKKKKK